MFGLKFKSWMETHLVRPRKKPQPSAAVRVRSDSDGSHMDLRNHDFQEKKSCMSACCPDNERVTTKKFVNKSDENINAAQYLSSYSKNNIDTILLPSNEHCYSSGANLSSPESAYSTGYSTDGTSPSASFLPEYYINIRSGKHYFHSLNTNSSNFRKPVCSSNGNKNKTLSSNGKVVYDDCKNDNTCKKICKTINKNSQVTRDDLSSCDSFSATGWHSRKACNNDDCNPAEFLTTPVVEGVSRRYVKKSPTAKAISHIKHLRATASNVATTCQNNAQASSSPRQRNRIRTNPWLSSNVSLHSACFAGNNDLNSNTVSNEYATTVRLSENEKKVLDNSQNASNCSSECDEGVMLQDPHTLHQHGVFIDDNSHRSPTQRSWSRTSDRLENGFGSYSPWKKTVHQPVSSSSSSVSSQTPNQYSPSGCSDLSDEEDADLTLNEILGKFDESYIYEKETDILSDSDPTDCDEDYEYTNFELGNVSGSAEETQCHEDFDFIDNGSVVELNVIDSTPGNETTFENIRSVVNKGHCTYHVPLIPPDYTFFRESFSKRSNMRNCNTIKDEYFLNSRMPRSIRKNNVDERNISSVCISKDRHSHRSHKSHASDERSNILEFSHRAQEPNETKKDPLSQNYSCAEGNCEVKHSCKEKPSSNKSENLVTKTSNITLNEALIKRLMPLDLQKGSRSAGSTPVALRKQLYTADHTQECQAPKTCQLKSTPFGYQKYVCNINSSILKNTSGNKCSDFLPKKRQFSVGNSPLLGNASDANTNENMTETFSPETAIMKADIEATRKYRELILEAEHILVSIKENMLTENENYSETEPQGLSNMFASENDGRSIRFDTSEGFQRVRNKLTSKTYVTSLSKKLTINRLRSCDKVSDSKSMKLFAKHCSKERRELRKELGKQLIELPNDFDMKNTNQIPCDLETNVYSGTSKSNKLKYVTGKILHLNDLRTEEPSSCKTLEPFQSIDLGNSLNDSNNCPLSEPVKRKVYSGSSMFRKLQKSLRKEHKNPPCHNQQRKTYDCNEKDAVSWGENLTKKLLELKRERLQVEAKIREAQKEERERESENIQHQEQVSQFRRQVLLHTIEGLKRSLEDQSAKLEETYNDGKSESQTSVECGVNNFPLGKNCH